MMNKTILNKEQIDLFLSMIKPEILEQVSKEKMIEYITDLDILNNDINKVNSQLTLLNNIKSTIEKIDNNILNIIMGK